MRYIWNGPGVLKDRQGAEIHPGESFSGSVIDPHRLQELLRSGAVREK